MYNCLAGTSVFCCQITYLFIVLPICLKLYMNFNFFCSTNNSISNPFFVCSVHTRFRHNLRFSGNTINAEGIKWRQEMDIYRVLFSQPHLMQICVVCIHKNLGITQALLPVLHMFLQSSAQSCLLTLKLHNTVCNSS